MFCFKPQRQPQLQFIPSASVNTSKMAEKWLRQTKFFRIQPLLPPPPCPHHVLSFPNLGGESRGAGFLSPIIISRQLNAASGILARESQSLTSGCYRNNVFHEELLVKKFPLTLRVQQSVVYKPSNSLGWAIQSGKNYNFQVALHALCSVFIL